MAGQKIWVGTILLLLLSTGVIYISMPGAGVKLRVDNDKSTFYVLNDVNRWVVSGREYNRLFDGSSQMNRVRSSISVSESHDFISNRSVVTRSTRFIRGPVIIDEYIFDGSNTDVELFPISHKVKIINGSGYLYRYSVDELTDVPSKKKLLDETILSFGLNMKLELDPSYRWAWIGWPYGGDSVAAQYNIDSDYEEFNFRLFDPLSLNLTLASLAQNLDVELGSLINATANIDTGTVCIDFNHPAYGLNVSCGLLTNSTNLNVTYFRRQTFNDSSTEQNLSYSLGGGNNTFGMLSHRYDDFINMEFNISGQPTFCIPSSSVQPQLLANQTLAAASYFYYNYTKPSYPITSVVTWEVKQGTLSQYNITLPSACFSASSSTVSLRIQSYIDEEGTPDYWDTYSRPNCYNGSSWIAIGTAEQTIQVTDNFCPVNANNTNPGDGNFTTQSFYSLKNGFNGWYQDADGSCGAGGYLSNGAAARVFDSKIWWTPDEDIECYWPKDVEVFVNGTSIQYIGLLYNVSLFSEDDFNGSVDDVSMSFDLEPDSNIAYVRIPSTANVTSAKLNITAVDEDYHVRSSATSTYDTSDSWNTVNPLTNFYDSSWSTWTDAYQTGPPYVCVRANVSFSYNIPTGANTSSIWETSACSGAACTPLRTNTSINASCLSYDNQSVYFKVESAQLCYSGDGMSKWWCKNESDNYMLMRSSDSNIGYAGRIFEEQVLWDNTSLRDLYLEVGIVDGVREWNWTPSLSASDGSQTVSGFATQINTFLASCSADSDGFCYLPLFVSSSTLGNLTVDALQINYTYGVNPISLNGSVVRNYVNSATGSINVPITISASNTSEIVINAPVYDYRGGNKTYLVTAHNTSYTLNTSYNLTYFYSNWNYSLANDLTFLEFIPSTPTTKNVTPYGQNPTRPMLNVSFYNYGGLDVNFSIYSNETDPNDCVNITFSPDNSKVNGTLLVNNTWTNYLSNQTYLSNNGLWLWADYNCNYTNWRTWQPDWSFRACCETCDVCDITT